MKKRPYMTKQIADFEKLVEKTEDTKELQLMYEELSNSAYKICNSTHKVDEGLL